MEDNLKHMAPTDLLIRYFAQEASAEERAQVEDWCKQSEANMKEFKSMEKLWSLTADKPADINIDLKKEWTRMEKSMGLKQTPVFTLNRAMQWAAIVLLVIGFSFLFYQQTNTIATKTQHAELRSLTLPDGSSVTLNGSSKLTYNKKFGQTHRVVKLKGEAYFDVSKDENKAFQIETEGAVVRVLGTKFNVRAYKENTEIKVTVVEGKVELFEQATPQKQVMLVAGETGFYHKNKGVVKKVAKANVNDVAWKTNKMNFKNTPLSEVVRVLENTYHVKIYVEPSVQTCKVTVQFVDKDLASVLKVLKSTLKLDIRMENDAIIIDGPGCE